MSKRGSKIKLIHEEETKKKKGKSFKRKLWSKEEDTAITNLVKEIGECNWGKIAERMSTDYDIKGRTGKQCRERWHNHLAPDVKKEPLTETEENQIFLLHIKQNLKWAEIAKTLGKRTDNAIKNHFYATLRRYMRRANKIMKSEAFKNLTEYPLVKLTCDYIYKCLMDKKISYEELSTVDSEKWQWINKHYLKELSLKKNEKEFREVKVTLNEIVNRRVKVLVAAEDEAQIEDGSVSRRSSRLSSKKRNNYSEESDNFNLYLLLELINYDPDWKKQGNKRISSNPYKTAFKRVKISETIENVKKAEKIPSQVFSNGSFGDKTKRAVSKLQNPKLDEILQNNESGGDSDNDSLDMNIGKKVKKNVHGYKPNVAFAEDRNFSNVSFLQDARNISKTSSIGRKSNPFNYATPSGGFKNPFDKNSSIAFDKFSNPGNFGRNKTKVLNFDNVNRFGREESDPSYRQSIFNDSNQFQTADHHFGLTNNFSPGFYSGLRSNPMNMVEKELSNPRIQAANPQQMPRLQMDNFQSSNMNTKNPSIPNLEGSHNTASFGQLNLRSGRTVSQVAMTKTKSNASSIAQKREVSHPIGSQVRTRSSGLKLNR
ncbi:unnamed protein product [Moneuplotes crassus]|uniref:Uncharacterized protein n=1 Tax=Euplotes crassus TaxID=5936 RepID=A0AAD1U8U1_EUPCR|nr:unnamed protein product [Moneuplotes crassus]